MRILALALIGLAFASGPLAVAQTPQTPQTPPPLAQAEPGASYPATLRMMHALLGGALLARIDAAIKTTAVPKLQAQLSDSPQLQRLPKREHDILTAYIDGLPAVFDEVLRDALPAIAERMAHNAAPRLTEEEASQMAAYLESPAGGRMIDAAYAGAAAGESGAVTLQRIGATMSEDDRAALAAFALSPGGGAMQRESKALFGDMKDVAQAEFTPRIAKRVRDDLCRQLSGAACRAG